MRGGKESEACSADDPCSAGSHFCDVDDSDDNNNDSVEVNTCKACPDDLTDCFIDGFASSHQAKINCHDCRMNCYNVMGRATITILSCNETTFAGYADEYLIQYSHQDVTGPLVDCSNLLVQKFVQKMTSRLKWRDGIPRGVCTACPTLDNGQPNPSGCFFSTDDYINWHYNLDFVNSCATSCHASLSE